MNDKENMRSEPDGNTTKRELSNPAEGTPPESLMPSLVALNKWLLAWEDRPEGADRRA